MKVRFIYQDIPDTLTDQLKMLVEKYHPYERAIEYLISEPFCAARGFSRELTEQELVRELTLVIREGAG